MKKHYRIMTKEVGRESPVITDFHGDVGRDYLIEFFGLKEDDVEWFRIEEVQDNHDDC